MDLTQEKELVERAKGDIEAFGERSNNLQRERYVKARYKQDGAVYYRS